MSPRPRAMGLVLAAGASRRARCAKSLVQINGRPFVWHALDTLHRGGCDRATAVVAPPHAGRIRARIGRACTLYVGTPERGMFASIKRGAEFARAFGYSVLVVSLVDHPSVSSTTVAALLNAYRDTPVELLHPSYAGRHGHPILISGALLERVARAPATSHTRRVLETAQSERTITCPDPAIHQDLDTAHALRMLRSG